jgi:acyl-CoA synthetase (AMP-forming)/AMP-acid ligase II
MLTSDIRCVPDMARVWCDNTPHKAALLDGGRVVSYAQLDDRSNRIANTLLAAGVQSGSHIGFLGKNSAAFFEIWVGANKAGCALAPLNWRNAAAELVEVIQDANVSLIFAGRDFTELAERVRQATETAVEVVPEDELDQWLSRGGSADPGIAVPDSATALLGYTSGTTAAPKGVPISQGALMNWFRSAATEPSVNWASDDVGIAAGVVSRCVLGDAIRVRTRGLRLCRRATPADRHLRGSHRVADAAGPRVNKLG